MMLAIRRHLYEYAGNYTVSLTVANNAGSDAETKTDYITVSEPASEPDSSPAVFCLNQNLAIGTDNDTIIAGSHTGRYGYFMSVLNSGNMSPERILVKPEMSLETPEISEYGWPDYASLSASVSPSCDRIDWKFPESFNLDSGEELSTYAGTSNTDEKNFSVSMSRALNRTIFTESGTQHFEFTLTYDNLDFAETWGRIEYPDSENVTASKVPYTINTDAPVEWDFGDDKDRFVFNMSRMSAGVTYHFSVDVQVKLSDGNTVPVKYKPKVAVWTVSEKNNAELPYGITVIVPADLLPSQVTNATAGSETETSWTYSGMNQLVETLYGVTEEVSGEIPDADFSADVTSGYVPMMVKFTDNSGGEPSEWLWSFGDGETSPLKSPEHNYTSSGNYTVSLTVANGAGSDTETKTEYITVYLKGDLNHNGAVDIGDAAKVAFMLVKKIPEDPGADFNCNGFVDIGDVSKIAYYIVGKTGSL